MPVAEASRHAVTPGLSTSALSPLQVAPRLYSAVPPVEKAALEVALLEALLDLVDRYWSGCKSLHGNEVFRGESGGVVHSDPHSGRPPGNILCACAVLLLSSGPRSLLAPPHWLSVSPLHCMEHPDGLPQSNWWLPRGVRHEGRHAGLWLLVFPPTGTLGFMEMPCHLVLLEMLVTDV